MKTQQYLSIHTFKISSAFIATVLLLGACGGGKNVSEQIAIAGALASDAGVAETRNVSEKVSVAADRDAPLTASQIKQGVQTAYACTTQKVSLSQNADTFVQFNPQAGIVYPGALIQGKSITAEGSMLPIAGKRGPGIVTLDIASGTTGAVSRAIEVTDHAAVTQAMNEILAGYDALTPAKASFTMQEVQSAEQLSAEVNANISGMTFDIASALKFDSQSKTSKLLVELKQEYFTMVFQTPETPEQVFAPGIRGNAVSSQMGPGNPPIYVGSVTYGRLFYMLFESSASEDELRASVSGAYHAAIKADASVKTSYARQLSETNVNSYAIGGSASGALRASTALMDGASGVEAIWAFFVDNANFSPQNPGAPISYKLVNLADNTPVRLSSATEYDVKQCQIVTTGCDGVEGSGKVKDSCGVCGGNNACKAGCGANTVTFGNDYVFIYVDLPKSNTGKVIRVKDLGVAKFYPQVFRCHHVATKSVKFECKPGNRGGHWVRSGDIIRDAWCSDSGEWDQSYVRTEKK